jgi:hypothetical protein
MVFTTDRQGQGGYNTNPSPEGDYYDEFGGTSAATPIVAGSAGLTYQMYLANQFGNNPYGEKPHASTIKALLISTAYQYEFTQANRYQQGWGTPDLQNMYDLDDDYFIVNEENSLGDADAAQYVVSVSGTHPLKISLVWTDPPGNPLAAEALVNDLSLAVHAPSGDVTYYGNCGLINSKWSESNLEGCLGFDGLNNVENVFIENPEDGLWTITVFSRIFGDGDPDTPEWDQPFALVASGAKGLKKLTRDDPYNSEYPEIAVSGDYTYVVWVDERDIVPEIYFKRSTDNGKTWDDGDNNPLNDNFDHTRRLSFTNDRSYAPSIDAIGTTIHVVWEENNGNVMYIASWDGGTNWDSPVIINTQSTSGVGFPDVSVAGNTVHVIWATGINIVFAKGTISLPGQVTWSNEMFISTEQNCPFKGLPRISSVQNPFGIQVHAVWHALCDSFGSDFEIFYKRSVNNGDSWDDALGSSNDRPLTDDSSDQGNPDIALGGPQDGDFIFVTWQDFRTGTWDIYYRRGQVWGQVWDAEIMLNVHPYYDANWPRIAAWGSSVYVVWTCDIDQYGGSMEVFERETSLGGGPIGQWSAENRITYSDDESGLPTAVDTDRDGNGGTHIAWKEGYQDIPFTYGEIYHFQWDW